MTKRPIFGKINISMFPNQPNQNGTQPPAPTPQPYTPPQPAGSGQYAVVPPLPTGQNNGHSGHNPYDFIVNPNTPKRSSLFGGSNFRGQIIAVAGIAIVLLVVLAVGASLFKPKSSTTGLIALAQRQQEIVRVATAGVDQAVSQSTKDFTVNTEASVSSSQAQLVAYLQQHGTKLSDKQLALDQSAETDTLLADAATTNTYDTALVQNLSDQLKTYEGLLQTTFKQTSNPDTKQLLQDEFSSANLLLEQATAVHP